MTSNKRTIAKATLLILVFAGVGKALGFVREMIVAAMFGTSAGTDAFFLGIAGPDFIREVIAGSVLNAVFIPVYAPALASGDEQKTRQIVSSVGTILTILLAASIIAGIPLAPYIVRIIAPGLEPASFHMAVGVTRIIFPAILFMGIASYISAILNTHRYFAVPSFTQPVMNVGTIIGALLLGKTMGVNGLAVGFLAGAVLQVIIQAPLLKNVIHGLKFDITISPEIRKLLKLWLPLFAGSLLLIINDLVSRALAAGLDTGSVSALTFANRLRETVWLMCGVPLATVIFPYMSAHAKDEDTAEFKKLISFAIRLTAFVAIPICMIMLVYAQPIVRLLFQRGAFTAHSTSITASALVYYSLGAFFFALNYVLLRVYYSMLETKMLLIIFLLTPVLNVAAGLLLSGSIGVGGIALSRSLSDMFMTGCLIYGIAAKFRLIDMKETMGKLAVIVGLSAASVGVSFVVFNAINGSSAVKYMLLAKLVSAWLSAGILLLISGYALRLREVSTVVGIARQKLSGMLP